MLNVLRLFMLVVLLALSCNTLAQNSIVGTKHNLTRSGPGTIKARPTIQDELCVFCHTPHRTRGNVPQQPFGWNRADSTARYTTYESSSMYASVGQPSGASKLCLSCHDGTIALGSILSQRNVIPFEGDWGSSSANLGTHLGDDHPISFVYDDQLANANGELVDPAMLPPQLRLDDKGELQCTTCHDPHNDSNGNFLVMAQPAQTLCVACHQPQNWNVSRHATSTTKWNGADDNPWPHLDMPSGSSSVAENQCQNCHMPHNAPKERGLLANTQEERTCLKCHNGNASDTDIEADINKRSAHRPQDFISIHDSKELATDIEFVKHVECTDCHNPHAAGVTTAEAIGSPGLMSFTSGFDLLGNIVEKVNFGYEVCFKCHAERNVTESVDIVRQIPQLNTRLEFQQENPSAHPVTAPRLGNNVVSLLPEVAQNTTIACTDCHGSDQSTADGGSGPDGPHGSIYDYLLVRNYDTQDYTTESENAYALCYGCHDRNSILNDESFAEHDSHVRGNDTPCSVCHDPHGISETQGSAQNHQYLINFDINVVSPNALGDLYWEEGSQGPGSSRCSLACHGVDHNNTEDRPIGFDESNGLSGNPNSWPFSGAFPD